MRRIIFILLIFIAALPLHGQDAGEIREGRVSFVTSRSVYVRFGSMESISAGDTLYLRQGDRFIPALRVKNLSSISCVCFPLVTNNFHISDAIYARPVPRRIPEQVRGTIGVEQEKMRADTIRPAPPEGVLQSDTLKEYSAIRTARPEIYGRLSVSSYSNLSGSESIRRQRMRYTFSMQTKNLRSSSLSAETHVSFIHSNTNREEAKDNIFNGLKIYGLSIKYDFNESMSISVGRKINSSLSTAGAIDGIQMEKRFSTLTLGAIAGSRPDHRDYSLNPDLLQCGIYLGHKLNNRHLYMQNSLAFVEQTNRLRTDRRFLYFQHSSWLSEKLTIFGSAEMDLYKKVNDAKETVFNLSNVYLSLRYRILHNLSAGLTYSSRQNVIYFETYKDFVDKLIDNEALQGWRFRLNARPLKALSLGVSTGYRYRKEDPHPSKNINGTLTYSQVPGIKASLILSATWLETGYLDGNIYTAGLTRELLSGKLSGGLKYRFVDYRYQNIEAGLAQNIFEAGLYWRVYRKLSLAINYEGSFETPARQDRLYINLSQRF